EARARFFARLASEVARSTEPHRVIAAVAQTAAEAVEAKGAAVFVESAPGIVGLGSAPWGIDNSGLVEAVLRVEPGSVLDEVLAGDGLLVEETGDEGGVLA